MASTTYGDYRITSATSASGEQPHAQRGLFVRLMDALAESRQRAAMIEIAKHAHLLSPSWLAQMDGAVSSRARRG